MSQVAKFKLNGKQVQIDGSDQTPLLFVLRGALNHKGTRLGCGEGHCGACTVTLDGKPVTSCNLPLSSVAGKEIGTIEGVLDADHPLIAALIRHQAGQCGYCLPGIVIRAAALIDLGKPIEMISTELDANLCRCGAHGRILAAIAEVAS